MTKIHHIHRVGVLRLMDDDLLLIQYNLQFFAQEGPGGEKTEEPTDKRLEDARKKGQVAKSQEINMAVELLAFFVLLKICIDTVGQRLEGLFERTYNKIPELIKQPDGYVDTGSLVGLISQSCLQILLIILPFLICGVVISFICSIVQVGFRVTPDTIKPDFKKLSPLSGIKKIFSVRSLFELVKSLAKIGLICYAIYSYLKGREESIFLLYDMPLKQGIALMGDIIINMGIRVSAVYMIIAAADLIFQKQKFHKDMMMTRQEIKDEMKDIEGDPQVKSRQKQKMREVSQRRMMQDLPNADVVITNPTHYAVAILYEQDKNTAPIVIAKGADYLAQKIKEVAKDNNIEIVENRPLARMLYANVDVGQMVPPELYKAVAEVLAFVYHLKGRV